MSCRLAMSVGILVVLAFLAFCGPAHADDGDLAWVRLTYYVEAGVTFSGVRTAYGQTACSWNFPLGTRFRFSGGETFVCTDRGRLGSVGWLDLWRRPDVAHAYGDYALVELVP